MSFLRRHPVLVAFLVVAFGFAGYVAGKAFRSEGPGDAARPPPPVVVAPVSLREIVDRIEAIGTARANESVMLTAQVTEKVEKVNFTDGMTVEAGDVVLELSNDEERAQRAEAAANLAEARKQLVRIEDLVARGITAESQLDEQVGLVEAAEARLAAIEARLRNYVIRAPFDGVLGLRNVSVGMLVTPNTEITSLDDISVIKLDFTVPETFTASLAPGMTVNAHSVAYRGRDFAGRVSVIDPRVDPVTRAVNVRALIPNEDGALKPGMLLTVTIVRQTSAVPMIPEQALVPLQERQYVYVVDDDDVARQVEVEIGRRRPGFVEIVGGLEVGARIVTEGTARVQPGRPVAVQRVETPSGIEGPGTG